MKEIEEQIVTFIQDLLSKNTELFLRLGIKYTPPEIKVINADESDYESEFVIYFYRDNKFLDVLECHIMRGGTEIAKLKEFESWIVSELKNIFHDLIY